MPASALFVSDVSVVQTSFAFLFPAPVTVVEPTVSAFLSIPN